MDRKERWKQRKLLLQIGKELTEEEMSSAIFILEVDINDSQEHTQKWKQIIESLEEIERKDKISIIQLVRELLEGIDQQKVIDKYYNLFSTSQESHGLPSNMLDTASQCTTDTNVEEDHVSNPRDAYVTQSRHTGDESHEKVIPVQCSDNELNNGCSTEEKCNVDTTIVNPPSHVASEMSPSKDDAVYTQLHEILMETSAGSSPALTCTKQHSAPQYSEPTDPLDRQSVSLTNSSCRSSRIRRKSWPVRAIESSDSDHRFSKPSIIK